MTQRWFEIRESDGRVVGIPSMSLDLAEANLPEGCILVPFDPIIDIQLDRWTEDGWERGVFSRPLRRKETDYRYLRRTGYDQGAQVGVMMKIIEALISKPATRKLLDPDLLAEFEEQIANNARVKAESPKP